MRFLKMVALFAALNAGAWIIPQESSAQQSSVSFQIFYDDLSPYGMWVDYPNYGYVWIPNGEPGFSPYATAGHWVFTDDGWTWVSDYPWGWAPFHYGRWDYDNGYGWFWVPDNEWGPAWVSWRSSPGYYGWTPLRPGISINIAFGRDYHERNERWNFVRDRDIARPDIGRHYVNRTNNVTIIKNSTVIVNSQKDTKRNAAYITGPNRDEVQKMTHTPIKAVAIRESDRPGQRLGNGELQIYRPQVQKTSGNGRNPAPSKVMKLNDVKPAPERNAVLRQQQTQNVMPPEKIQPSQLREIKAPNNVVKEKQSQNVTLPRKSVESQPVQPKLNQQKQVNKEQTHSVVNPPKKIQPPQPQAMKPSNNMGKGKQPATVTQPKKVQPPKVASPNQNHKPQPSEPRINQEEKKR